MFPLCSSSRCSARTSSSACASRSCQSRRSRSCSARRSARCSARFRKRRHEWWASSPRYFLRAIAPDIFEAGCAEAAALPRQPLADPAVRGPRDGDRHLRARRAAHRREPARLAAGRRHAGRGDGLRRAHLGGRPGGDALGALVGRGERRPDARLDPFGESGSTTRSPSCSSKRSRSRPTECPTRPPTPSRWSAASPRCQSARRCSASPSPSSSRCCCATVLPAGGAPRDLTHPRRRTSHTSAPALGLRRALAFFCGAVLGHYNFYNLSSQGKVATLHLSKSSPSSARLSSSPTSVSRSSTNGCGGLRLAVRRGRRRRLPARARSQHLPALVDPQLRAHAQGAVEVSARPLVVRAPRDGLRSRSISPGRPTQARARHVGDHRDRARRDARPRPVARSSASLASTRRRALVTAARPPPRRGAVGRLDGGGSAVDVGGAVWPGLGSALLARPRGAGSRAQQGARLEAAPHVAFVDRRCLQRWFGGAARRPAGAARSPANARAGTPDAGILALGGGGGSYSRRRARGSSERRAASSSARPALCRRRRRAHTRDCRRALRLAFGFERPASCRPPATATASAPTPPPTTPSTRRSSARIPASKRTVILSSLQLSHAAPFCGACFSISFSTSFSDEMTCELVGSRRSASSYDVRASVKRPITWRRCRAASAPSATSPPSRSHGRRRRAPCRATRPCSAARRGRPAPRAFDQLVGFATCFAANTSAAERFE